LPLLVGPKNEIEFTATFNESDLLLVNRIREMLQDLVGEKIFQRESLREASLLMKRCILELITKLRKPIAVSSNTFRERWKQAVWGEEEWESTAVEADPFSGTEQPPDLPGDKDIHARGDMTTKKLFPSVNAKPLVKSDNPDDEVAEHGRMSHTTNLETTIDRVAQAAKKELTGPMLACRQCQSEISPLHGITRFVGGSNPGAEPYFKILDCPGMSFPGMRRDVVCRNGHSVGALEQGIKTINTTSNVCVILPDSSKFSWGPKIWKEYLQ